MKFPDFVRLYPLRAANVSWLFGAGSSVSAGLPSAYDLIWDFKRRIYASEERYSLSLFNNLSDPATRRQIQSYFDGKSDYPKEDSNEEYSFYFDKAYPSSRSRKEYIEHALAGMQLTFGHKVIGVLMKLGYVNMIFTTNFDKAFENIATKELKDSAKWFCADLDNSEKGLQQFQANKFPLIVKLHGDFQSDKLKNTLPELQTQDEKLRHILTASSYTKGLAVMGYSGRDSSIMDALFSALDQPNSFPHGIFWFIKSDTTPLPIVQEFMSKAIAKGIDGGFIEIETFDTAWADIIKGFTNIPATEMSTLNENYFRRTNIPLPGKGTKLPLIRLNAFQITKLPATARVYKCSAGNMKEVREIISNKKSPIIAIRKRDGIVGFGADSDFQNTFEQYGKYEMDIYSIPIHSLSYDDSSFKELMTESISRAIVNNKPLLSIKRRGRYIIIPDPKQIDNPIFSPIKNELNAATGIIPNSNLQWIISLEISIQYKLQTAFLLVTPSILAAKADPNSKSVIAPFIKEFQARWYNNKYNTLLTMWQNIIFQGQDEIEINAFDSSITGINAGFKITKQTLHSRLI